MHNHTHHVIKLPSGALCGHGRRLAMFLALILTYQRDWKATARGHTATSAVSDVMDRLLTFAEDLYAAEGKRKAATPEPPAPAPQSPLIQSPPDHLPHQL